MSLVCIQTSHWWECFCRSDFIHICYSQRLEVNPQNEVIGAASICDLAQRYVTELIINSQNSNAEGFGAMQS